MVWEYKYCLYIGQHLFKYNFWAQEKSFLTPKIHHFEVGFYIEKMLADI